MYSLHVVIVKLQCCIATEALESNYVICIIIDFGANFAQRKIT